MAHKLRAEIMLYGRGFRILRDAQEAIPAVMDDNGEITENESVAVPEVLASQDVEIRQTILLPTVSMIDLNQLMDELEEFLLKKYPKASVK